MFHSGRLLLVLPKQFGIVRDSLLQSSPPGLISPLLQQLQRQREVCTYAQSLLIRKVINEVTLWGQPAQDGRHVVPIAILGPGLETLIADLGV
jgi:hypothetical protein